jgi:hypothetical protein
VTQARARLLYLNPPARVLTCWITQAPAPTTAFQILKTSPRQPLLLPAFQLSLQPTLHKLLPTSPLPLLWSAPPEFPSRPLQVGTRPSCPSWSWLLRLPPGVSAPVKSHWIQPGLPSLQLAPLAPLLTRLPWQQFVPL